MKNRRLFRLITLVSACLLLLITSQTALTAPNEIIRVSVASNGEQANDDSLHSIISADGRFVAFQSFANNLVPGDTNGVLDIFVHDRQTGQTARVSVGPEGVQGNGTSVVPAISADGRFVAFQSRANNLVPGDNNSVQDIFVHDRDTGETTRVSVGADGMEGNDWSNTPTISGDGNLVAFRSVATNLVAEDTNGAGDIFVHNRTTGQTTRVSVDSNGVEGNWYSEEPVISENGNFVAFISFATNLVANDTNGNADIFVHDRENKLTTRVSVDSTGLQGDGNASNPAISADGHLVAFESRATNLVAGITMAFRIFSSTTAFPGRLPVSVNSFGVEANAYSIRTAISGDGRFVAFQSNATNLVAEDTNETDDVFFHNRKTGETLRVSVAVDGTQGDDKSCSPSISEYGHYVAFDSRATNLVHGNTNNSFDIIVRGLPYPEVTVDQAAGQPDLTVDSPINFTAAFTKPIDTATFDGSDVISGGTAGPTTATVTEITPNDGTTFNIAVNGMTGYGTVSASIPPGVVDDPEGYLNAASTSTDNEVIYANTVLTFPLFFR